MDTKATSVDAMLLLIENAYELSQSERVIHHKINMAPNEFRQHFGSIQIRMYRQSGHSTTAALMLYALSDAVVFVLDHQSCSGMRGLIYEMSFLSEAQKQDMISRIGISGSRLERLSSESIVILDRSSNFQIVDYGRILTKFRQAKLFVELQ